MNIIKRIFAPKEVKVALNVLYELSLELESQAFREIRSQIEKDILSDYQNVVTQVKDGESARQLIYFSIANLSEYQIESGQYHIYRGILNPLGNEFLNLFYLAVKRLLEVGAISEKEAKKEKAGIRKYIRSVG